jgi:hypothetical protein
MHAPSTDFGAAADVCFARASRRGECLAELNPQPQPPVVR